MDQNTRVFYGDEEDFQESYDFEPEMEAYEDDYAEQEYEEEAEDHFGYEIEDEELYEPPHGEGKEKKRFRVAMNVFDTVSVLMGVVVILALTTLLISIVSWLRTDIIHSFVLLQSTIQ